MKPPAVHLQSSWRKIGSQCGRRGSDSRIVALDDYMGYADVTCGRCLDEAIKSMRQWAEQDVLARRTLHPASDGVEFYTREGSMMAVLQGAIPEFFGVDDLSMFERAAHSAGRTIFARMNIKLREGKPVPTIHANKATRTQLTSEQPDAALCGASVPEHMIVGRYGQNEGNSTNCEDCINASARLENDNEREGAVNVGATADR